MMNIKPANAQHSALYTELNELNKIRQTAKDDNPEALRQVAQQFEQMFMSMLMKSMREANQTFSEDNFLNSSQVQFYEGMLDEQMTMELAQNGGIGLADVLVKQLSRQFGTVPKADTASQDDRVDLNQSRTEQMLNRAFDNAGNLAASAVLGQAQGLSGSGERPPEAPVALAPVKTPAPVLASRFDTPESFVEKLMPLAEQVSQEIGVDPKVLLAQAALETGWGKHLVQRGDGSSSFNLFNIKADSRWQGDRAAAVTLEYRDGVAQKERAAFRAYDNFEASFRDYIDFLKSSPRYQQALEQADNPVEYLRQLQQAGYATDPRYADKIANILDGELLADSSVRGKNG